MKKIFITFLILLLNLLFSVSVFAKLDLDTHRWKWITSNEKIGLFYDTQTVKKINDHLIECWVCKYYPDGCKFHSFEHSHYSLELFDYRENKNALKMSIVKDANGKEIKNYKVDKIEYSPIVPDTVGDVIAITLKEDFRM